LYWLPFGEGRNISDRVVKRSKTPALGSNFSRFRSQVVSSSTKACSQYLLTGHVVPNLGVLKRTIEARLKGVIGHFSEQQSSAHLVWVFQSISRNSRHTDIDVSLGDFDIHGYLDSAGFRGSGSSEN
jgi:hypothetical protein